MRTYDLSGRGVGEKLIAAIRQDILSGYFSPGEKLPSKRRLAEHHGISVQTVQNAYEQLIAEGFLDARERSGYFVAAAFVPAARPAKAPARESEEEPSPYTLDLASPKTDAARFPFALWARLSRRVLSEERDVLGLSPAAGIAPLRRAIAAHLAENKGITVSPSSIVVGAGNEYLYMLLVQLIGRDKTFGVENPGYTKIAGIYTLNGVRLRPLSLDAEGVVIDTPECAGVEVLHISPNHHFPTGAVTSAPRRAALLSWASAGDRYIIEDDYNSEFRFCGKPIPPLFSMDGEGKVVYLNTFSDTIAPSIRISYMILPPKLLARYRELCGVYACPVPVFEQHILTRFLSEGHFERHLRRMRAFYRARRDEVIEVLKSSAFADRLEIFSTDAGLHFLVRIKTEKNDETLREMAKNVGVRVAFLEDYYIDGVKKDTHTALLRYADVAPEALKAALCKLAKT